MNWVRPFLDDFMSLLQGSFIPGIGTFENIIVGQRILHSMRRIKGKKGAIVFEIDLEKII